MKTVLSAGILLLCFTTHFCFAQASQSSEYTYTGTTDLFAEYLTATEDGQLLQLIRQQEGFYDKTIIMSTDTLGEVSWIRSWGNDEEILRPRKLLQLSSDDIIVAATYFNPFQGGAEMALLYLEEDGSFQRQSVYATIAAENIWDIVPIAGDKFWVLGDISINDGIATLLLEIDNQGEVLRQITLKDDQFTYYTQLTLHPDGGLFLSGRNGASGVNKSILSRLDSNWNVLWTSEGSLTDTQVFGHEVIAVDESGNSQQLVRFNSALWLVEHNAQGTVTEERWLGNVGEPVGFETIDDRYIIATLNGALVELSADFEVGQLQFRDSDFGTLSTQPVVLNNNSVASIGQSLNEDGQFIIVQQKGAAALAPGCVGYFASLSQAPDDSGLSFNVISPTVGSSDLSLGILDLAFGAITAPASVNTCIEACSGPPSAAFSIDQNGLSVSLSVMNVVNETDYEWELSNGETYSGSNLDLTLTEEGTYEVCLTSSNDCGRVQSCQSFTVTINTTRELLTQPLKVSPNPIADNCWIEGLSPGYYRMDVFDALGRIVHTNERYFSVKTELSTTSWTSGQYYIQLTNENNRYVARLLKS
ncbi:MAG: PKD domain-containing protein [Bacteroidota bacterium]